MEGHSSDNLTTMLEKVTEGATGALSDISMDGLDESEFQDLVGKIGDGATNTLSEIRMEGYDHEKPPSELTDKIQDGTSEGFTKIKNRSDAVYITGVSASQADGTYGSGQELSIRVSFSQTVFVEGSPALVLETGETNRSASYASGTGSSTLVFSYIIQPSDLSPDLDYASPAALLLNGGSIKDGSSKKAMILLPPPGTEGSLSANKDLFIGSDSAAPANVSVSINNGAASTQTTEVSLKLQCEWITVVSLPTMPPRTAPLHPLPPKDGIPSLQETSTRE